jgi:phosphatidylglycerol:prolipoprotein diacylglycerol transferase
MRTRIVEWLGGGSGASFLVPDYAFVLALAIVIGVYLTLRRAEASALDSQKVFRVCLAMIGVGLVSARLYVVIQHWDYYALHTGEIVRIWEGGLASYGAFLGGAAAAVLAAIWQRVPPGAFLDACAPSVALSMALGRVGCFLSGCCYGGVTDLPWAVRFPQGSDAHVAHLHRGMVLPDSLSLPVHPTQLYEALYALALFVLLVTLRPKRSREGATFALLFLVYPIGRFFLEFLRDDVRGSVLAFSTPQLFSLVAIALAASFLLLAGPREANSLVAHAQTNR